MPERMLAAEFESPAAVIAAAERVRELGYRDVEAYSPFPLTDLDEALARPRPRVPPIALAGGIFGAISGLLVQWWTNAYDYPIVVGGRPAASWPTYVVIVFEATVLCTAIASFLAVLLGARMPRLHDPIFDLPNFERATVDRFWLTIRGLDPATNEVAGEQENALRGALQGAIAIHGAEA